MKRLLLFCLFPLLIHAERPDDLSLEGVSRAALANNPGVKEALEKWSAMRARIPQEAAWDDPRVSVQSRLARFVSIPPNAFADQTLSVEQMIPLSGRNRSRARAATAEAISAFEEVRRRQLDVLAKARAAYFRLANAYAQIELNRGNLISLQQIAESSRAGYQAGSRTGADVLVADTEASKLLEARRDLETSLAAEQSRLNVLMNRDAFAPLGKPADVPIEPMELPVDKLRALALSNRPEVRMAEAAIEAAKARLELAHREWIPEPALSIQGQRYNGASQAASELDAGISFNIPWGNHKKYSAAVREAAGNLAAARQALDAAQRDAIGLLRDALEKIETARHHAELYNDKIVPRARQAFKASQLAYESGKTGFSDWITAQRNVRDLDAMARQSQADCQVAIAELEAVIGADLGEKHAK